MLACNSKVTGFLRSPLTWERSVPPGFLHPLQKHLTVGTEEPPVWFLKNWLYSWWAAAWRQQWMQMKSYNSDRLVISRHLRLSVTAKDLDRSQCHLRVTRTKFHTHERQVQSPWGFETMYLERYLGYSLGFQSQSALLCILLKLGFNAGFSDTCPWFQVLGRLGEKDGLVLGDQDQAGQHKQTLCKK